MILHKDYDRKGWAEKEISGREPKGARRQDELIGGNRQSQSDCDADSVVVRHKLLHNPSLTGNLCIPCMNVTYYSAVIKDPQSPYWPGRRDSTYIVVLKLRRNKCSAYVERLTPFFDEEEAAFQITYLSSGE
jgi:hypothetical protein